MHSTTVAKTSIRGLAILGALAVWALPALAADVSLDVPVVSTYVWRGIQANPDPVLQPSLTVNFGAGASFNLWGNMDLTGYGGEAGYGDRTGEFTEVDLTGAYGIAFGPVSVGAGVISYIFPGLGATTHELYLAVGATVPANPTLTVYSDVDEIKGSYFLLALSESFPVTLAPLASVDLGVTLGYGSGSYNRGYFGVEKAALVDLVASLGLPFAVGPVTLTPSVLYSSVMDSEISDALEETGYVVGVLKASVSF